LKINDQMLYIHSSYKLFPVLRINIS